MELRRGYKQTDVGVIPQDWEVAQIGSLKPFVTSGSRGWAVHYSEHGSPFVRITNLSRTCIYLDLQSLRFVKIAADNSESVRTRLHDGDILISITADIGMIGFVTPNIPKPAYINQHIALVRFDSAITNSRFVSYFLASGNPQKHFRALTDSGAKAGLNLTTVQQIRFALPPARFEQDAIAEALSDADALIESLEQLLAKKRQIKQGAMQELLTGKKRLPKFQIEAGCKQTDVGTIPQDWVVCQLREGVALASGQHVLAKYCNTNGEGVAYITGPADFTAGIIQHTKYTIRPGTSCSKNDILVTVKGSGAGTSILSDAAYCISRQLMAIRVQSWHTQFVLFSLLRGWQLWGAAATGSIPGLSRDDILGLTMAFPPTKAEQGAIAGVLSDMDAEIAALEAKLAKARDIKQGMMQELLTGRIRLV